MQIHIGIRHVSLKTGELKEVNCPNCHTETNMKYEIIGGYANMIGIPMLPVKRKTVFECCNCHAKLELKLLSDAVKIKYRQQQEYSRIRTPLWYYSGMAFVVGILCFAIYIGIQQTAKEKTYAQNPRSGDIYRIRNSVSGRYTTAKVNKVMGDSVSLYPNDLEVGGYSGIDEINIDKNYKTLQMVSRQQLEEMYKQNIIYQIDREE